MLETTVTPSHARATTAKNEQKTNESAARLVKIALEGRRGLGNVIDVGCGVGQLLAAGEPYASGLAGVDVDEELLQKARSRFSGVHIISAGVEESLPFPDESFDTVFFCDVIEHLHDPIHALLNLQRVLAPGGRIVVTTPNSNSFVRTIVGRSWFGLSDPSHLIFFTRFSLTHVLEKTGFGNVRTRTLGLTGFFAVDRTLELFRSAGTLLAVAEKIGATTHATSPQ